MKLYKLSPNLFNNIGYIAVAIILFINTSCYKSKEKVTQGEYIVSDSTLVKINIDLEDKEAYAFDSLINDISFVRLETNENCLIGDIHQILCTDEYIFILDAFVANAVYCFDKQGKFVRKIGRIGEGPGEYLRLNKMDLTSDKSQIVLYDWIRLHYYDLNGNYIKDINPGFYVNDFKLMDDDIIVGFKDSGLDDDPRRRMLAVYNKDCKLLYREFPTFHNEVFHLNNGMHPLRSSDNEVYLREPWTHSIYKIEKDKCYEKYRINIVGGGYPERSDNMDEDTFLEITNTKVTLENYVLLKNYALFYYTRSGFNWSPFVIYSHKTEKTYRCNGASSNPLFFAHGILNTPPVPYNEETFLIPQSAIRVMRMKEVIYNSPLINDSKLMKLYDGLTEDSNPVLFLLHIKSI